MSVCNSDPNRPLVWESAFTPYALMRAAELRQPTLPPTPPTLSETKGAPHSLDGRGAHWREKILSGRGAPEPWRANTEWAARFAQKELEMRASLPNHCVPWRIGGYPAASSLSLVSSESSLSTPNLTMVNARQMGNTSKVLYMELMLHEMRGVVVLTRSDRGLSQGFLGILHIVVAPEQRQAFDAGLIPSRAGLCEHPRPRGEMQGKTVVKIWQTAGFTERARTNAAASTLTTIAANGDRKKVSTLFFDFSEAVRDKKRIAAQRAHEKRGGKNKQAAASVLLPTPKENLKRMRAEEEEDKPQEEDEPGSRRMRLLVQHAEALAKNAETAVQDARIALMRATHCAAVAHAAACEAAGVLCLLAEGGPKH